MVMPRSHVLLYLFTLSYLISLGIKKRKNCMRTLEHVKNITQMSKMK